MASPFHSPRNVLQSAFRISRAGRQSSNACCHGDASALLRRSSSMVASIERCSLTSDDSPSATSGMIRKPMPSMARTWRPTNWRERMRGAVIIAPLPLDRPAQQQPHRRRDSHAPHGRRARCPFRPAGAARPNGTGGAEATSRQRERVRAGITDSACEDRLHCPRSAAEGCSSSPAISPVEGGDAH